MGGDVNPLLLGRELDHSPTFIRIAKGGEDLPTHTEVGVVHVAALLDFGQAQSEAPELIDGHGIRPGLGLYFLNFLDQRGNDFK